MAFMWRMGEYFNLFNPQAHDHPTGMKNVLPDVNNWNKAAANSICINDYSPNAFHFSI